MNSLLLLLIGGLIGFLANLLIELLRNRLELRRSTKISLTQKSENRYEDVKEFFQGTENAQKTLPPPAWLKVLFVLDSAKLPNLRFSLKDNVANLISRKVSERTKETRRRTPSQKDKQSKNGYLSINQFTYEQQERIRSYESLQLKITSNLDFREFIKNYLEEIKPFDNEKISIQGTKYLLGSSNLIGRDDECDIVLPYDELVSRKHAIIRFENEEWFFYNLSPSNDCWINGLIMEENSSELLVGGEVILIGKTLLSFDLSKTTKGSTAVTTKILNPINTSKP